MGLTEDDKRHVKDTWAHVRPHPEAFGSEALDRMFKAHPTTKTYFPHFDLTPGSAQIRAHGKKLVDAITAAADNMDNMEGALSKLSTLHAQKLRVDPSNFGMLQNCIQVTIAAHSHGPLDPAVIRSIDKFLVRVIQILISFYR